MLSAPPPVLLLCINVLFLDIDKKSFQLSDAVLCHKNLFGFDRSVVAGIASMFTTQYRSDHCQPCAETTSLTLDINYN